MKNVNMRKSKIENLFTSSWQLYAENITYIIGLYLSVTIIGGICNYIINKSGSIGSIKNLIFYFSSELFLIGVSLGLLKILLLLNKKQPSSPAILFTSFDLIFKSFNASILFGVGMFMAMIPGIIIILMSCEGMSLLTSMLSFVDLSAPIPTITFNSNSFDVNIHNKPLFILGVLVAIINIIWVAIRFQFYQYFIVDEKCGAIQSLKKSYHITGNQTNLLFKVIFFLYI